MSASFINNNNQTDKNKRNEDKKHLYFDRGDTFFPTPDKISDSGIKAILEGKTHYTDPIGVLELRNEIALTLYQELNSNYNPENEILVTSGASPAIFVSILSLSSQGDYILVPDPCWPTYIHIIRTLKRKIIRYPVGYKKKQNGKVFFEHLKKEDLSKVKLIIINSPHNPTGIVFDKEWFASLGAFCKINPELVILSDETYNKIVFDDSLATSPAILPELKSKTLIIRSFSKSFAMAGWRVGFLAAEKHLLEKIKPFHLAMNSFASSIAQEAAMHALKGGVDLIENQICHYKRNRNYLVNELNKIEGVQCNLPKGTFYAFPDIGDLGMSGEKLAKELAILEKISVNPGLIYGENCVSNIRICFASSHEELEEFVKRLVHYIQSYKNYIK